MKEYEALGHMEEIRFSKVQGQHYFLPHHAVFKSDSTTTKTRVVFDASAKTSTNYSLNDVLSTGPTIQPDVFTIILRFRIPRYAFTADIEKMYRQVWVNEEDRKFQLIWWRDSPRMPLRCMQLATITYGTTCAPYLATRILQLIADTNKDIYPLATNALQKNFYVDDVLAGSDKITTALAQQEQLREVLRSAGLNLRKWCANDDRLLKNIPEIDKEVSLDMPGSSKEHIKTMGLTWYPKKDNFVIKITQEPSNRVTKRTALADISRLFDPLGLVAPVVVTAKIFLQQLWKLKLDWDAALPHALHTKWLQFRQELMSLQQITIERHIFNHTVPKEIQLHIFADASEAAYGAAAYVRAIDSANVIVVRLLCSKSRVAPVKQITLPRLELCAAKLATDLGVRLQEDRIFPNCQIYYWTDSTAVLGWISASSSNFHTFVANRISAIQQVSTPQQWHHVRTECNPADLTSRGLMPKQLINNVLWFYGPLFLHAPMTTWPLQPPRQHCDIELRQKVLAKVASVPNTESIFQTIKHSNSLRKLQRIIAYVHRFVDKVKNRSVAKDRVNISKKSPPPPSANEMERALKTLVKVSQYQDFAEDFKNLRREKCVHNNSSISSLSPFIDESGILRVGGRLQASTLSFDAKHQILLSYHAPLTKMLFTTMHQENQHVGAQTLLSMVRQRFWPLKGKNIARSTVQGCVLCTRAKPKLFQQLMGALPKDRVQPARPFINTGVDFFGPVWVHVKIRGKRPLKSYVAVFCCFATKAVHLELVSDLSTDAFLGALRRFMARRGHCSKLYCDNATNFVGAKNQLQELNDVLFPDSAQQKIYNECSKRNVVFSFIPPRAPHFGGLWEAAVKSAKHLLYSTLSIANLTREEMETVLAETEAIMNSRPLTPMSSDPHDLAALTPGHFLIGEPLTATTDPHANDHNLKPLTRWKLVSHLKREFWKRWSTEYLHTLQHRYKWKKEVHDIKPDTMVLIKDDNLPSFEWSLGRIKNVIRGEDGLVRVADVQTSKNLLRRPITKLAPLPIENDFAEEIEAQNKLEPDITHLHKPKQPKLTNTLLTTLLIAFIMLPLCFATNVENQPFRSNPGIYYERIGSAHLIASEWNIISYVNISNYWKWTARTKHYPSSLNKICKISRRANCATVVSLIEHLISELDMNNELMKHNPQPRARRGAFNIVGNIANSLFGIMDESHAAQMVDTIDQIRQNEHHLAHQMRLQKSFLDNTLNILKKDELQIETELQKIETSFITLSEDLRAERVATEFNDLALQTTLAVMYLQRIQESVLDVLTDSHHGKINPSLISPQQMQLEMNNIKTNLPSSLKLPDAADLLKLYSILKIEARIMGNVVLFNIKIPLVAPEEMEILKLTPVPWIYEHQFKKLRLVYTFLIINLHRDQYFPLEENTLNNCTIVEQGRYICLQHHPLHFRGSEVANCEVSLLNQATNKSACEIETLGPGIHWAQLYNPNWWLYAVDGEIVANAVCGDSLTKIILKGSGLLRINENCIIKQPLITIRGHQPFRTSEMTAYVPDINITDLTINDEASQPPHLYAANYSSQFTALNDIQQKVTDLDITGPHTIRVHDIHHYFLGYACLTCICLIIGYMIRKRYTTLTAAVLNNNSTPCEPAQIDAESQIITINNG